MPYFSAKFLRVSGPYLGAKRWMEAALKPCHDLRHERSRYLCKLLNIIASRRVPKAFERMSSFSRAARYSRDNSASRSARVSMPKFLSSSVMSARLAAAERSSTPVIEGWRALKYSTKLAELSSAPSSPEMASWATWREYLR